MKGYYSVLEGDRKTVFYPDGLIVCFEKDNSGEWAPMKGLFKYEPLPRVDEVYIKDKCVDIMKENVHIDIDEIEKIFDESIRDYLSIQRRYLLAESSCKTKLLGLKYIFLNRFKEKVRK